MEEEKKYFFLFLHKPHLNKFFFGIQTNLNLGVTLSPGFSFFLQDKDEHRRKERDNDGQMRTVGPSDTESCAIESR